MQAPCKNCPDRHYLCHSQCEKYKAFQAFCEERRERRIKENKLADDLYKTSRHSKTKARHRPYKD